MNNIKFLKSTHISYLLLSLLIMGGCTFYKTLEIAPVTDKALSAVYELKKTVAIHDESLKEYLFTYLIIEKDSISGYILPAPEGKKHKPMKKSFLEKSVTAHEPLSTMHLYSSLKEIQEGAFSLSLKDIRKVEIHDKAPGKSVVATTGLVLGVIAAFGGIALIEYTLNPPSFNCPKVETCSADGTQFQGTLFPGSIFKSLKRKDYLILENFVTDQDHLKLRVFNNLPEVEYIDQLGLLEVDHTGFDKLGVNNENKFIAYNKPFATFAAIGGETDLSYILAAEDEAVYDFNDEGAVDQLNAITLQFDRADFSNNPYLVIRGKQSQWLETVANFTFYNIGKSYDKWVKQKDKASKEKWKRKNSRQGVSLNIYLKENDNWEYIGSHHDAGTLVMRNLLMSLDLENNQSPNIEIKLESAYKLWELDYVGLTDSWNDELAVNTIDFTNATDQNGQDVLMNINSTDDIYQVQDSVGTFIELHAAEISTKPNTSLVLQGTGYYHHIRNFNHKTNLKFVRNINTKRGIHEMSRDLYHYKTIMAYVAEDW